MVIMVIKQAKISTLRDPTTYQSHLAISTAGLLEVEMACLLPSNCLSDTYQEV